MQLNDIFDRLWIQYSTENPSVERIHTLFEQEGETIENDHVAFRTYDHPLINVDRLSMAFVNNGYVEKGQYHFKQKKLYAKHFEKEGYPRVFISQLLVNEFSESLQSTLRQMMSTLDESDIDLQSLPLAGQIFGTPSYKIYEKLRTESEYAAWVYAFGFRANHFTVSINHLDSFTSIHDLNEFLKSKGFALNSSGGEVKGTPAQLLEQSSTLADRVKVRFSEGSFEIPSCYYEFAKRYKDENDKLFSGFIADSADKIFESTDYR